jgi:hypothetical protein
MASESVTTPAADESEGPSIVGVHRQPLWFEEKWDQVFRGSFHGYRASDMERALHGASGVAAVLARDERSRMLAESCEIAYDGLSAADRENLMLALEALHFSAMMQMEAVRDELAKRANKESEWIEIPVVGPAQ